MMPEMFNESHSMFFLRFQENARMIVKETDLRIVVKHAKKI